MKYVPKSQAKIFTNSGKVDVLEYGMDDPDIDGALATVNDKYPDQGFVVNEECKELLYVISGSGTLITKTSSAQISPGDAALINKGELFRYENCDNLHLLIACAPAWRAEQHKEINDD
jgi:mannose-6-phosphate isomerase-like protein (cupin superfamily)